MPQLHDLLHYAKGNAPTREDKTTATQVTFPDLHGNALAALYRLEAEGILELTPAQRIRVAAIYLESENTTPGVFIEFERILDEVTVHKDKFKCVRFIGDVLGDRGKSDILTLLVLRKLKESTVNTTIVFSNHDLEMIAWRLSKQVATPEIQSVLAMPTVSQELAQRRSLDNSIKFLEKEAEPELYKAFYELIDDVYKPMVKLIDYTVKVKNDRPIVTLFTHAPAGLEVVESLARYYKITFDDLSTQEKLTNVVDEINARFAHELMHEPDKFGATLARELKYFRHAPEDEPINPFLYPFVYAAWNRSDKYLIGILDELYDLKNLHGHMGRYPTPWENLKNPRATGFNIDYGNVFGSSNPEWDITHPYGKDANTLGTYLSGYSS